MEHPFPGAYTETRTVGSLQEFYTQIVEYYDELFPVNTEAVSCILRLLQELRLKDPVSPPPMYRFLGIGCGTGNLENRLSTENLDITGIDANPDMIATAQRRIKASFSRTRFFEMNSLDISRFLKAESFNFIACLENMLPYIGDDILVRKFFYDTKRLLAPGGILLLQVNTFNNKTSSGTIIIPERSSIRVKLNRNLIPDSSGKYLLEAKLEHGMGQILQIDRSVAVYPLSASGIASHAREAGFSSCEIFGDFNGAPLDDTSTYAVIVCRVP